MEKENTLTPNLINRTEMKQVAVSDDCLLQRKFNYYKCNFNFCHDTNPYQLDCHAYFLTRVRKIYS